MTASLDELRARLAKTGDGRAGAPARNTRAGSRVQPARATRACDPRIRESDPQRIAKALARWEKRYNDAVDDANGDAYAVFGAASDWLRAEVRLGMREYDDGTAWPEDYLLAAVAAITDLAAQIRDKLRQQ